MQHWDSTEGVCNGMTDDDLLTRLARLRPELTNVLGFHELLDGGHAKTPLDAVIYQVHLNAAAVKLATEIHRILQGAAEPDE